MRRDRFQEAAAELRGILWTQGLDQIEGELTDTVFPPLWCRYMAALVGRALQQSAQAQGQGGGRTGTLVGQRVVVTVTGQVAHACQYMVPGAGTQEIILPSCPPTMKFQ